MAIHIHTSPFIWFTFVTLTCSLLLAVTIASNKHERKVYIAYMGDRPKGEFSASTLHNSILQEVGGSVAVESLLYSYQKSFNGFVAKLTKDEAQNLAEREDVVSVFPNQKLQLQTTRSWDFMGLPKHAKRSTHEGDIIVGMLDTGIWLKSKSFSSKNFGPPPKKWKGTCQKSSNFTCNNKIIGARYYRTNGKINPPDVASPLDIDGHGSHTASIAAGDIVQGASMVGLGLGDIRGGVPGARLAVYKICWDDGCSAADILAAFDDAIADGVDIISISVSPNFIIDYFADPIAIGSFHALKNGILTSNAAGNNGPTYGSISSVAPWILSVAASTIDRKFVAKLQLGNGEIYEGLSLNAFDLKKDKYPFIYAKYAGYNGSDASNCVDLDEKKVKGKIVLCDQDTVGLFPLYAGAAGMVVQNETVYDVAYAYLLPTTYLNNGSALFNYLNSTKNPTAKIFKSISEKDRFAPSVASFSSRGPNLITHDILKPDITGPGVNILAAYSEARSQIYVPRDKSKLLPYLIMYGTSMSCPHASGAAAYIKSFHPEWSPAAIKSALMTTAFPMNPAGHPDNEFSYGAGHLNPSNATNPGLVYDAGEIDYIKFLCGQGYSRAKLIYFSGNGTSCSKETNATVWDLNYPSFTLSTLDFGKPTTRVFHRTVTNVGSAVSTYKAVVKAPKGLTIQVRPSVLSFTSLGEKKSFVVNATVTVTKTIPIISGSLTWYDGLHRVRSPVVGYRP